MINPNWEYQHRLNVDGLKIYYLQDGMLGLDLNCEDTLNAIFKLDKELLKKLRRFAEEKEELKIVNQFNANVDTFLYDTGYGYGPDNLSHVNIDQMLIKKEHCEITINSELSTQLQINVAKDSLSICNKVINRKKLAEIKKKCTKERRKQFQSRRSQILLELIARDDVICVRCNTTEKLHIDHIKALSKGGTDDLINLQFLCQRCNTSKGDRI